MAHGFTRMQRIYTDYFQSVLHDLASNDLPYALSPKLIVIDSGGQPARIPPYHLIPITHFIQQRGNQLALGVVDFQENFLKFETRNPKPDGGMKGIRIYKD